MQDVYIGDIWRSKKGIERKVIDLVHEGYFPDDPNDMGSFEEFNVYYESGGKKEVILDCLFADWIEKTKAVLVGTDSKKRGYRDSPG